MPDYNELSTQATAWTRCYRITIENPGTQPPLVRFAEEDIAIVGSKRFTTPAGELVVPVVLEKEIELVNPETGELIGQTITHAQLYVMLHSAYLQSAKERDIANMPVPGPQPTENENEPTVPAPEGSSAGLLGETDGAV